VSDIFVILTGFVVGVVHVLLGPDHLVALAPFAVEARRKAWVIGLRWGVGHAIGIIVVGMAGYAAVGWLDIELLSRVGERLVGLMLVAIGVWAFIHLRRARLAAPGAPAKIEGHVHTRAAFLLGAMHGVAGTGGVLGVLPAMAQPSWFYAGAYLVSFGTGSIVGMMGFASLCMLTTGGRPAEQRSAYRWPFVAASVTCLLMGVLWMAFPNLRFDFDWAR